MPGKFARRNPASVTLTDDQVALLDAIALCYYNVPRSRLVQKAIDLWLPVWIEEIERRDPAKGKEIRAMETALRTHVERKPPAERVAAIIEEHGRAPAPRVVDLAARRDEKMRRRIRERL